MVLVLNGCTPECGGPSCESAWPRSELIVARGSDLRERTTSAELPDRVLGSLVDGAAWEVDVLAGTLVVGMPERGSVALLERPVGEQSVDDLLVRRFDRPGERFGASVAVVDGHIWVGAPDAEGGRGAVYRYPPDAVGSDDYDLRFLGTRPADGLGANVVACGDLTGDGRGEVLVNAQAFATPDDPDWSGEVEPLAGAVFLLRSDQWTSDEHRPWRTGPTWVGGERAAGAGWSLACGDLTADGEPDIVIGAPFVGADDAGAVFVRAGEEALVSGTLRGTDPYTLRPREGEAGWFGASLAVDDGRLAVGAPGASDGAGVVAVYSDVPSFPGAAFPMSILRNERDEPEHFGTFVGFGDLDGDGGGQLAVGMPDRAWLDANNEARSRYDVGVLWMYDGPEAGSPGPERRIVGERPFERVGRGLRWRDVDGDGADELLLPTRAPE